MFIVLCHRIGYIAFVANRVFGSLDSALFYCRDCEDNKGYTFTIYEISGNQTIIRKCIDRS